MSDQNPSDKILHQDAVEEVIEDHLVDASTQAAVTNLVPVSASYTKSEIDAIVTRVNVLTQVCRDAGLIPNA